MTAPSLTIQRCVIFLHQVQYMLPKFFGCLAFHWNVKKEPSFFQNLKIPICLHNWWNFMSKLSLLSHIWCSLGLLGLRMLLQLVWVHVQLPSCAQKLLFFHNYLPPVTSTPFLFPLLQWSLSLLEEGVAYMFFLGLTILVSFSVLWLLMGIWADIHCKQELL